MLPSADVVVIGGGVIGTAITYYLIKQGIQVCLVERGDLGSGTSSTCADGVLLQTKTVGPKLDLARASLRLYHGLAEELETDLEFTNDGGMLIAQTEPEIDFVRGQVEKLQHAGVQVEYLKAEEARSLQPALAPHICGASYCPEDSSVNPLKLVQAYANAAQRLGATFRTFTTVVGIERQGDKISAVLTAAGKIPTETIVNAAGIWAPALSRMVGLDLPIIPRKGELVVTEAVPPVLRGRLISANYLMSKQMPGEAGQAPSTTQASPMQAGVLAGQTHSGQLLIGSTREFAGWDRRSTYRAIRELIRQTVELLPFMRHVHVLRSYAGLRPATADGLPILERSPHLPGFFVAAGHEGDGIALSPVTGKLMAELITGKIGDAQLAPFASSRFANQR